MNEHDRDTLSVVGSISRDHDPEEVPVAPPWAWLLAAVLPIVVVAVVGWLV